MRVLVCGGQGYADRMKVREVLDGILIEHEIELLVHGGWPGADTLAGEWAVSRDVQQVICKQWPAFGRGASERSARVSTVQQMVDILHRGEECLVVAFPGGLGTSVLVGAARATGIRVVEVAAFEEPWRPAFVDGPVARAQSAA
jgi:hypothetical protein